MDIVLASRNKGKAAELETLLSEIKNIKINVLSLDDIGYHEDTEETGATFEENARIKAKAASDLGYIAIADDSGLTVDHLGGAPGIYSARYSGKGDKANTELLLKNLEGVPYEKRTARFVTSVVCIFPEQKDEIVCHGECEGKILTEPRGSNGFGYDPVFLYEPFDKTFAELAGEEKNKVSHRGKAMRLFARCLKQKIEEYNLC